MTRHNAIKACLILLPLAVLSGTTEALADSCPYCGRSYGGGPSGSGAYLSRIRANHEASCSGHGVYVSDLDANLWMLRWQMMEAARKLREVTELGRSLESRERALFDSIPETERQSIEQALDGIARRYRMVIAENQKLRARLARLEDQSSELHRQVLNAEDRGRRLLRDIRKGRVTIASLEQELAETERELHVAHVGAEILEETATRQTEMLRKAREAYFKGIGDFFRGKELGSPRDYTVPIYAPFARTSRSVKHVSQRLKLRLNPPVVATVPSAAAVAVNSGSAFLAPDEATTASGDSPTDASALRRSIARWEQSYSTSRYLHKSIRDHLIDAEEANRQLRANLKEASKREAERGVVKDQLEILKRKVDWALYDLDISTSRARSLIAQVGSECAQEQRWNTIKKLWELSLRDKSASHSAYSLLRLGHSLMKEDLPRVAQAARDGDSPLTDELIMTAETRGSEFWENLLDLSSRPLPVQKWFEKLIGQTPHPDGALQEAVK